jgi:hypothetical protein
MQQNTSLALQPVDENLALSNRQEVPFTQASPCHLHVNMPALLHMQVNLVLKKIHSRLLTTTFIVVRQCSLDRKLHIQFIICKLHIP